MTNVPVLVEGTADHPDKPFERFSLTNVSGTCRQGISLANTRGVKLNASDVSGYTGRLLRAHNVSGKGLDGAVEMDALKVPEAIAAPVKSYKLQ